MRPRWDVVVVGSRVAGASTALLLARAGLRVLCLDRARPGSDTVSTHALMRAGVLQLHRWGLLDAVVAAGTPAVRRTVFHYGEETVPVTIRPMFGVDALRAPRRTVLDSLLGEAATRAGATLRYGTAVTGLHRDARGRVTGVVTLDRRGTVRTERAGLVVGADGRDSLVAAEVGAEALLTGRSSSAFVYGYWTGLPTDGYEWFYRPGASAGAIPTNDGLTCLFVGARRSLAGGSSLQDRLAGAARVGSLRHVRGRPTLLRRGWGPGWALVGDAGSWKDPLSTHGMTDALRDAELLARAVVAAPVPGRAQAEALAGYQAERDRLTTPMLAVVERLASYDWDLTGVPAVLRTLAGTMTEEVELLAGLPPAA
jgi:2-polyprenyl-6-methoxyphenol hydroxylase-like FAD-dependent oxidoreductase